VYHFEVKMSLIIVLRNISSLAPVSDYEYQVMVGDGTPERSKTIANGTITGHRRADGWQELVQQMLRVENKEEARP
jgi:hypothetical protein